MKGVRYTLEIKEMTNQDLLVNYTDLLDMIDQNYKLRKEFEEEMKTRRKEGRMPRCNLEIYNLAKSNLE